MKSVVAFAFVVVGAASSPGQTVSRISTGATLKQACGRSKPTVSIKTTFPALCHGYIEGVVASEELHQSLAQGVAGNRGSLSFCPSTQDDETYRDAAVIKYLDENPAKLHLSAAILVQTAMHDLFPCTQ